MRREIKLIILVFVLVVGPAIALSFLAARVLGSWQIVLQKRMSGEAARVLDEAVSAWERELALLRIIPAMPRLASEVTAMWVAHGADITSRNPWVEGIFVFQPGSQLFYPAVQSVGRNFERSARTSEMESLLNSVEGLLARGETNAAIECLEKVIRNSGGGRSLLPALEGSPSKLPSSRGPEGESAFTPFDTAFQDPEEGFFLDLVALRKLAGIVEGQGVNSRLTQIKELARARMLARFDDLVPLQRESMIQWLEEESSSLAGTEGGTPAMIGQWRERRRAMALGPEERSALVGRISIIEPTLPETGWMKIQMKEGQFLVAKIAGARGGALVLALKINEARLITYLNNLFAIVSGKTEIRVRCQVPGGLRSSGSILASRQLPIPLEGIAIAACPADIPAFVANARLQMWLYRVGGLLLIISVVAGVGLIWREAVSEIHLARERSDFVATVSHDLRTPLSSMRMLAESLYMGLVSDEAKQKKFLGAIIKESDRLSRLTDRALYFIRYGQGALRYQFTEGNLGEVVREAVRVNGEWLIANGARNGGRPARINVDIPPDFPHVKFDAGAIEQVVHNLLDNAVKYSSQKENILINVQLSTEEGTIVLSVQDYGVGMTPEEVKQIMKPYVRGKSAARQNARGIGLGLALCQHIVQAHGGRIQIESELGKGSKFKVILPG